MGSSGSGNRAREEEHGEPTASRRRRRAPRKPAPPADGPPTVPTDDAIRYLATVKREFAGETGKYEEFLAVLPQCRGGSTGEGHPDLIRGFNDFLPRGNGLKEKQGGDDDA
ncbi:hypothetical protein GQ55_6G077100 [Panicum hallii var. hallii]|uniref:Histone deacetylase interacting domain-containing protein n=1 Tax=Panicum hallii var. hallii TaxID=1504633 RepID=A0A2T7D546_9POAL|nr:hypothetical protein GQ55_6G077100 [Panicum hallii var. hallii]